MHLHLAHGHSDILALVAQCQHAKCPEASVAYGWDGEEGIFQHLVDVIPLFLICIAVLSMAKKITRGRKMVPVQVKKKSGANKI